MSVFLIFVAEQVKIDHENKVKIDHENKRMACLLLISLIKMVSLKIELPGCCCCLRVSRVSRFS